MGPNVFQDGGFNDVEGTITFIATKCDDVSCTEAINSLNLEDDPDLEDIEKRLSDAHDEIKENRSKKTAAEKLAKGPYILTAQITCILMSVGST